MSFAKIRSIADEIPHNAIAQPRTHFRCAARGCPNAAAIDDHGEDKPGKCFHHWRAPMAEWDAITSQIRKDPAMRNHGIVPVQETRTVRDMKTRIKGKPMGMRTAAGPALGGEE